MREYRISTETIFLRAARQFFQRDLRAGDFAEALAALIKSIAHERPGGQPGSIFPRSAIQAECESRAFAARNNRAEQVQFTRREFGKPIEPKRINCETRTRLAV